MKYEALVRQSKTCYGKQSGAGIELLQSLGNQAVLQLCKKVPAGPGSGPAHGSGTVYSQSTDPSVKPFLKRKREYMGQDAMEEEVAGKVPPSSKIRVRAVKHRGYGWGLGMHEAVPTDLREEIPTYPDRDTLAGMQSGLRTSTGFTVFKESAHSGMMKGPNDKANWGTSGQASAHNTMREWAKTVGKDSTKTADEKVLSGASTFISSLATGDDIMSNPALTGGRLCCAPSVTFGPPGDPSRINAASVHQELREHTKRRINAVSEDKHVKVDPPLSPERPMIDKTGTYVPITRPSSPLPMFAGTGAKQVANISSYLVAPYRPDHESALSTVKCSCGTLNQPENVFCKECFKQL